MVDPESRWVRAVLVQANYNIQKESVSPPPLYAVDLDQPGFVGGKIRAAAARGPHDDNLGVSHFAIRVDYNIQKESTTHDIQSI